jgi:hypothetical protein
MKINIKDSKVVLELNGNKDHIDIFKKTLSGELHPKYYNKLSKHFEFLKGMTLLQQEKYSLDLALYVKGIINQLDLDITVEAKILKVN